MDMKVKQPAVGALIDKLDLLRDKKRKAAEALAVVEAEYNELSTTLIERLQQEGMPKASGKKATVSISNTVVANVDDWDSFTAYVKKTGYFHLIQRRVSDPAYRELLEKKGAVPGLKPFTKVKLNHSSLKE